MITIIYKEYKLQQNDVAPERFDLFVEKIKEKGKDAGQKYHAIEGYAFNIDNAIKRIVGMELQKKNDVTDLSGFHKLFTDMLSELKSFFMEKGYS